MEEQNSNFMKCTEPGENQELVVPMLELTDEKVLFVLVPRVVIAAMQTTMIRANMTAYSTAVGPSSFFKNETIGLIKWYIKNFLVAVHFRMIGRGY